MNERKPSCIVVFRHRHSFLFHERLLDTSSEGCYEIRNTDAAVGKRWIIEALRFLDKLTEVKTRARRSVRPSIDACNIVLEVSTILSFERNFYSFENELVGSNGVQLRRGKKQTLETFLKEPILVIEPGSIRSRDVNDVKTNLHIDIVCLPRSQVGHPVGGS